MKDAEQNEHKITIENDGIRFDGTDMHYPFSLKVIDAILGEPVVLDNPNSGQLTYVWHEAGVRAFVDKGDGDLVKELGFYLAPNKTAKYIPDGIFSGSVEIDGQSLAAFVSANKYRGSYDEFPRGLMSFEYVVDTDPVPPVVTRISFYENSAATPVENSPLVPATAEKPLRFTDFNFKLAVLEELMYGENAVLPPFSINDFVAGYSKRSIDVAIEGYDPIPEVVDFLKVYEIDEKHAPLVTSLYLDGGNQIYHEIAPFWGGESSVFDIENFSDVVSFPNLKEITNELSPFTFEQ